MVDVRIYRSFESLPPAHRNLFSLACTEHGFFSSLCWFQHLCHTLGSAPQALRIYCAETPASRVPTVILTLVATKSTRWRLEPRKLSALANYYTSLFRPITASSPQDPHLLAEGEVLPSLESLVQAVVHGTEPWDVVQLQPLASEDPLFCKLIGSFRKARVPVDDFHCFGNWYLDISGRTYQEYFDSLPSKLKNTLRRKHKQLSNQHRLRIEILSDSSQTSFGIELFQQIYAASWKTPEPYPQFLPGLIRLCAEQGWLRLGVAWIDGQPAAAQVWIVCSGVASIYKLAYDERYASYSVGSLLTARLMEHVIDTDRVKEVDYLTGDEPYKRDWMSHRRERRGIIAFNLRTPAGLLAAIRHYGGKLIRRSASKQPRTQQES